MPPNTARPGISIGGTVLSVRRRGREGPPSAVGLSVPRPIRSHWTHGGMVDRWSRFSKCGEVAEGLHPGWWTAPEECPSIKGRPGKRCRRGRRQHRCRGQMVGIPPRHCGSGRTLFADRSRPQPGLDRSSTRLRVALDPRAHRGGFGTGRRRPAVRQGPPRTVRAFVTRRTSRPGSPDHAHERLVILLAERDPNTTRFADHVLRHRRSSPHRLDPSPPTPVSTSGPGDRPGSSE